MREDESTVILAKARRIAALWAGFDPRERGNLTRKSRDLTDALYQLTDLFERADDPDHVVIPDAVNRAPSVSGFYCGPQDGEARKIREFALDQARRSWVMGDFSEDGAERHAHNIILIARMFENYLSEETS